LLAQVIDTFDVLGVLLLSLDVISDIDVQGEASLNEIWFVVNQFGSQVKFLSDQASSSLILDTELSVVTDVLFDE
jgi:hypothetical protein